MTHTIKLRWVTPNAGAEIVHCARVSTDPAVAPGPDDKLLHYLLRHSHWSPFEMANICFEVDTTRDIARQMLRHWTMRPQEFSQRYQDVRVLGSGVVREARMQHPTNRQAALPCDDRDLALWWRTVQEDVWEIAQSYYGHALNRKIAKEVARTILPEGMTPSKLYFNAPIRSVIHFIHARLYDGAQLEIRLIAEQLRDLLIREVPALELLLTLEDPQDIIDAQRAEIEYLRSQLSGQIDN